MTPSPWDEMVDAGHARRDVPLAGMTTYKLGGPSSYLVEATRLEDLREISEALQEEPIASLVIGRGSNLLVADVGFDGVVVHLGGGFAGYSAGEDWVEAGAAHSLPRLARAAAQAGQGELEWCVGVPGSVGGGVRQNAGCFGREVVDVLASAQVFDLLADRVVERDAAGFDLGYRRSNVTSTEVVIKARFNTTQVSPDQAASEMREVTRWRRDHQPGGTLNAGSVFKNPDDAAAGAVIEEAGLKGFAMSGVRVSPRHANFIEAESGARSGDVHRLILAVQETVAERTGRLLEPEIQFVGFGDD